MPKPDNKLPFWRRFLIYQKERFPLIGNGLLISAFTFSAVSYSRICRNVEGFISWKDFAIGIFATITLFLLVRIFDEFKDREDDAKYRSYLPVPRGLVSLSELRKVGLVVGVLQIAVIAIFQLPMLWLYAMVLVYLLLMAVEFFIPNWLRKRQLAYITSHMVLIPLIDIYASGLDWLLDGASAHWGLAWFFAVSYVNGLVLEFGRKMRTPDKEEDGVVSYTGLYGLKGGPIIWVFLMAVTLSLALGASHFANYGQLAYVVFASAFVLCAAPGIWFILSPTQKGSKLMEYASALWTILMYLGLGGIPMISSWIS